MSIFGLPGLEQRAREHIPTMQLYLVWGLVVTQPVTTADLAPYPFRLLHCTPLEDLDETYHYLLVVSCQSGVCNDSDGVMRMYDSIQERKEGDGRAYSCIRVGYYYEEV